MKAAALALLERTLKLQGLAVQILTEGMRRYYATMRELGNVYRREIGHWMNNRSENSPLPFP